MRCLERVRTSRVKSKTSLANTSDSRRALMPQRRHVRGTILNPVPKHDRRCSDDGANNAAPDLLKMNLDAAGWPLSNDQSAARFDAIVNRLLCDGHLRLPSDSTSLY